MQMKLAHGTRIQTYVHSHQHAFPSSPAAENLLAAVSLPGLALRNEKIEANRMKLWQETDTSWQEMDRTNLRSCWAAQKKIHRVVWWSVQMVRPGALKDYQCLVSVVLVNWVFILSCHRLDRRRWLPPLSFVNNYWILEAVIERVNN